MWPGSSSGDTNANSIKHVLVLLGRHEHPLLGHCDIDCIGDALEDDPTFGKMWGQSSLGIRTRGRPRARRDRIPIWTNPAVALALSWHCADTSMLHWYCADTNTDTDTSALVLYCYCTPVCKGTVLMLCGYCTGTLFDSATSVRVLHRTSLVLQ